MNDKNSQSSTRFLNCLFESLGESEGMSTEEVKEEIAANGIDPDSTLERLMGKVREASNASGSE
jgi:hypothetical protein